VSKVCTCWCGVPVTVFSDSNSLTYITSTAVDGAKLTRLAFALQVYMYTTLTLSIAKAANMFPTHVPNFCPFHAGKPNKWMGAIPCCNVSCLMFRITETCCFCVDAVRRESSTPSGDITDFKPSNGGSNTEQWIKFGQLKHRRCLAFHLLIFLCIYRFDRSCVHGVSQIVTYQRA
jgi:hypothetical protein